MESLELISLIRELVETHGYTHANISEEFRSVAGETRGFSERSVRRFCSRHGIHSYSLQLNECDVDRLICGYVSRVCIIWILFGL